MPKILPSLAAPSRNAAAADASRTQSHNKTFGNRGGFDEVLNSARKKNSAPAPEPQRRAEGKVEPSASRKTSKAKASERAEARADARAEEAKKPQGPDEAKTGEIDDAAAGKPVDEAEAAPVTDEQSGKGDDDTNATTPVHEPRVTPMPERADHSSSDGAALELPEIGLPTDGGVAEGTKEGQGKEPATASTEIAHAAPQIASGVEEAVAAAQLTPVVQEMPDAETETDAEVLVPVEAVMTGIGNEPVTGSLAPATDAVPPSPLAGQPKAAAATTSAGASQPSDVMAPAHTPEVPKTDGGQPDTAPNGASNRAAVIDAIEPDTAEPVAAPAPVVTSAAGAASPTISPESVATMVLDASPKAPQASAAPAPLPPLPPEVRFAEDNHANIITSVRTQLLPDGGTMRIRLDPPQLGPLAVTVRVQNGVMEASFETSNDEAAKLLSHSLGTLKTSLESQGVSVERLHVQQAPKEQPASQQDGGRDQQQGNARDLQQEQSARQEQQRREMLRRMWQKLSGAQDPLDMVA